MIFLYTFHKYYDFECNLVEFVAFVSKIRKYDIIYKKKYCIPIGLVLYWFNPLRSKHVMQYVIRQYRYNTVQILQYLTDNGRCGTIGMFFKQVEKQTQ